MTDRENTIELLRRGYDEPSRSLHFRVGFYDDHAAVCECLRAIDSYNEFAAQTVIDALAPLEGVPCHVDVGREFSPVIYVRAPLSGNGGGVDIDLLGELGENLLAAHADEVNVEGDTLRAWWD